MTTAFQGGVVPTVGIEPQFISQAGAVAASTFGTQLFQGAGQTFYGKSNQQILNSAANNAINIALNPALGSLISLVSGYNLSNGSNYLASAITSGITGSLAAGINQSISAALASAGPFGSILSQLATGSINNIINGIIGGNIFGFDTGGPSLLFPGAGDEPRADYGGNNYTNQEVVFSIQPANAGPQSYGLDNSINFPNSATTLPFNDLINMPQLSPNAVANAIKYASMFGGVAFNNSSFNGIATQAFSRFGGLI